MTGPVHRDLAAGRWFELSLCEQLGNVGSEVHRALAARRAGRLDRGERAFHRALELLDLTIADPRWRDRLREICRVREVLCDDFAGGNRYGSTDAAWTRYFDAFGIAARSERR